jgi:DNA polymerase
MRRVGDRFVIAMFHPAAALHQAALKPSILADFAKLPQLLEQARAALVKSSPAAVAKAKASQEEEAKQLKLF